MARYLGSVCKVCRRYQEKLMFKGSRCYSPKCSVEKRRGAPGRRRRRISDRGLQLMQKQKARYTYGVLEKQFRRFFAQAEKQQGITGDNLLVLLERRFDNVVYRLGFADSRSQARQLVQHGHLLVNGRKTNIPSYIVKEGDTISWRESSRETEYYKQVLANIQAISPVSWLSLDRQNLVGRATSLPSLNEIDAKLDGKTIVEYYSR